MQTFFTILHLLMQEAALLAATGFLVFGCSDLLLDCIWMFQMLKDRWRGVRALTINDLPVPQYGGAFAVFIPAWQEADVIGDMLRHALKTYPDRDYLIYVGCYPNDAPTIREVEKIKDPRIRLVAGGINGPTTKAENLNRLWRRMLADETVEKRIFKAVIIHDAEDVVHPLEFRVFDSLVEQYDLVQLPVQPLIASKNRWVGGHYADEFAESHGKDLVVRTRCGAALPCAGVGCAFPVESLRRISKTNDGDIFDATSLTEDYEFGLKLKIAGGRATFARVTSADGERVVTRAYFPHELRRAVMQKGRWVAGIALFGWENLGWSGGWTERWMRFRDRASLFAALCFVAGYLTTFLWLVSWLLSYGWDAEVRPVEGELGFLLFVNILFLLWRLSMRAGFVVSTYGWAEGARSIPRAAVSNLIAILAAFKAVDTYFNTKRTGCIYWAKTQHVFPSDL